MSPKEKSEAIFNIMYNKDWFSQWLGIELVSMDEAYCKLKMKIRNEMLNGFEIAHGGIVYSLADSALAFASNSLGRKSVSIETSISHTVALKENDEIYAEAKMKNLSNKIGIFEIEVKRNDEVIVALFKGTVYRTSQEYEL